jgi:two-component system phosphate regulon sensor histidine kinase PhoR
VTLIKEIERMRREFLDNASHELKTPISAILAASETLLEREPADSARRDKFYRTIQDNTTRLHNLINDMLDLSEIEQKKAALELEPVNINPIVRDVIAEFWPAIGKKNHTLEVKAPGEDVIVEVDRRSLAKALGNLVDNAIRYTEPGGRIAVRIVPLADSRDVRIDVEDSGIGIPAPELDRVFERFYRVDKARSMRSGGTGLGLAIVKHIMEAMGGRVAVQSQPGKGSVFTLFVPILHRAATQPPSPNVSGSSSPPARILDVS